MTLGYDKPLYMLAFDHRGSFQKDLLGIDGVPNALDAERISDAKRVLFDAFMLVAGNGVGRDVTGLLVDEQFGWDVAARARVARVPLAMPVEKSGQDEFDFEFGDAFGRHIEKFDPTFAKVLVRYNPEGDREANQRQADRLRLLSDWLHERGRRLLFELLIPPTAGQLDRLGGDRARYDLDLRPALLLRAMHELQKAGVEPDVWKIEGLERRSHCEFAVAQARSGGRDAVACIVLGRGADEAKVVHWLEEAASVPGFVGFAVGRTLWWHELRDFVAGRADRTATARRIAANYRRLIDAYVGAAQAA